MGLWERGGCRRCSRRNGVGATWRPHCRIHALRRFVMSRREERLMKKIKAKAAKPATKKTKKTKKTK